MIWNAQSAINPQRRTPAAKPPGPTSPYRRAGGESQSNRRQLFAQAATEPEAAKNTLAELRKRPDLPLFLTTLIPLLEAVLNGSRDSALADDPNLGFDDAAELLLLIETLTQRDVT